MMTEEEFGYLVIGLMGLLALIWPLVVWIWVTGPVRWRREN
jgi:hypothetical protein